MTESRTAPANSTWPLQLLAGFALAGCGSLIANRLVPGAAAAPWRVALAAHAADLGFHLGLGVAAATGVWLARRLSPRAAWPRWAALAAVSLAASALTLPADVGEFLRTTGLAAAAPRALTATLVLLIAVSIPLLAFATHPGRGWRARGAPWLRAGVRVIFAALAVLTLALNVRLAPHEDPGVHLYASCVTALLCARALPSLEVAWGGASRARRGLVASALGGASLMAAWAALYPHPLPVLVELGRQPSAPHLLAALHGDGGLDTVHAVLVRRAGPFFAQREGLPPVPPSGSYPKPAEPIVIYLSFDSLRDDVLTKPRNARHVPNLVELSQSGVNFTNARAPGSMTKYTLGSVSRGKYFSQQYWTKRGKAYWPRKDQSTHLGSLLSEAGVFTGLFPAAKWLKSYTGLLRGFRLSEFGGARMPARQANWVEGGALTSQLIEQLEKQSGQRTFFLVHYLDSHNPFYKGGRRGRLFNRYLRALGVVDGYLAQVRQAITRLGLADRTLLIVTSDHGEAFGEHKTRFHGGTVYDELIAVPLVLAGAGLEPRSVDVPVSLIDIGPTVLDWFSLPTPASFMGESLVPLLFGGSREFSRPIVADTQLKRTMVFPDGFKVIYDQRRRRTELYDLNADPGELHDLMRQLDPAREPHALLLRSFFHVHTFRENGYRVPFVR